MRKGTAVAALIVTLILGILSAVMAQKAAGQTTEEINRVFETGTFVVKKGTTLWNLACTMGNCQEWQTIFDTNVALKVLRKEDYSYDSKRGWPMVLLKPGQNLILNPALAANASELVDPMEEAAGSPSDPGFDTAAKTPGWLLFLNWTADQMEKPAFWLIFFALALLAVAWSILRGMRNPTTAGLPMREGGINDQTAPDYFRKQASRTNTDRGEMYIPADQIRLISIIRGKGNGPIWVRYRGEEEPKLKVLQGEAVYRATVEYPDGRQEEMYCLQACANDLVFSGTRYSVDRLFRFETDTPVSIYSDPPQMTAQVDGHDVRFTAGEIIITSAGRTFTVEGNGITVHPEGGFIISADGHQDVIVRDGRISGAQKARRAKAKREGADASTRAAESPSGLGTTKIN